MAFHLYQEMFQLVDHSLEQFITQTVSHLTRFLTPIFSNLVVIMGAIWGYMILYGKTEALLQEGLFKILRITFIMTLGLSVGTYMELIVGTAQGTGETLAAKMMGMPAGDIANTLDRMMEQIFSLSEQAWQKAGILQGDFGMYFVALVIGMGGAIVMTYLSFLVLASKVLMTVILAVGPIFFIFLLFEKTQKWFENWLGYLMNAIFILLFAVLLGSFCLHLLEIFLNKMLTNTAEQGTFSDAILLVIMFLTVFMVLMQVPNIASGLGGGLSLATKGAISHTLEALRPIQMQKQMRGIRRDARILMRPAQNLKNILKKSAS